MDAGVAIAAAAIIAAIVVFAQSVLGTYRQAQVAQAEVAALRSSLDVRDWPKVAAQITPTVEAARGLAAATDSLSWRALSAVPAIGPTADAVTDLAEALSEVGQAAEPLAPYAQRIVAGQVRRPDGSLDLATMEAVRPLLNRLASSMESSAAILGRLDITSIRPEVAVPLVAFQKQLTAALPVVTTASNVLTWLPDMLGANGERRWLVMLQNPAEVRGSGGFVGGFVILEARDGRLTFARSGSSTELAQMSIDSSMAPEDSQLLWGEALESWGDFNVTPNFPLTGSLAASGMLDLGERVDGVIAVDPAVVAALTKLTGPVSARGKTVTADNVERFFTVDAYSEYPDGIERDEVSLALVEQSFQQLLTAPWDPAELSEGLDEPLEQGRIRIWSSRPEEQAWLANTAVGGVVPDTPGPVVAVALNNAAANKTDAFVRSSVTYLPGRCMTSSTQDSALAVNLRNDAPSELRGDNYGYLGRPDAPAGDTKMLVHIYAPVGAGYLSSTLDGQKYPLYLGRELNRDVWWTYVELPRSAERTLEVQFNEPTVLGIDPRVLAQPMVIDQAVTIDPRPGCKQE